MAFPPQTRWLAPASMFLALTTSLLFILGHHFFYNGLDGHPATDGPFMGTLVSKQEANIAIGTAFAFLVKAFLVFAMSIAFAQVFWREAKFAAEPPTLARLDGMHASFYSVLSLANLILWLKFPLLLGMAAGAWLVPIASIITPATLSIQTAAVVPAPSSLLSVPNLDFLSLNFLSSLPYVHDFTDPSNLGTYLYNGPSQDVLEISNAVMSEGKILRIPSPAPNASWEVEFTGPSLQCNDLDEGMHKLFQRNIVEGTLNATDGSMLFGYLAWFPRALWWGNSSSTGPPFLSQTENGTLKFSSGQFPGSTLDSNITFYVVAMPDVFGTNASALHSLGSPGAAYPSWIDGTMIACTLYNSTYRASFAYLDGDQQISISHPNTSESKIVQAKVNVAGPNPLTNAPDGCASSNSSLDPSLKESCYNNPTMLTTLSYQAVMDAFTSNLLGSISVDGFSVLKRQSSVLSTALLHTQELAFLQAKAAAMVFGNETLQAQLASSPSQAALSSGGSEAVPSSQPLGQAIEQMFENFTVSLMSLGTLQPTAGSATTPRTNVTLPTYRNIYVYSAFKLWAAYGVALFLAALAIFIGFVAMWLNGACYSNNFSTIFRVARGATVSRNIREEDVKGADPLPEYLTEATVRFDVVKNEGEEYLRYRRQDSRFK